MGGEGGRRGGEEGGGDAEAQGGKVGWKGTAEGTAAAKRGRDERESEGAGGRILSVRSDFACQGGGRRGRMGRMKRHAGFARFEPGGEVAGGVSKTLASDQTTGCRRNGGRKTRGESWARGDGGMRCG